MTVRWTEPANDDFLSIITWLAAGNPVAASAVGQRILAAVQTLEQFPFRGRAGRSPETRELVIAGLPYLVIYGFDTVDRHPVVLRVLHGAMLWPPK